MPAKNTVSICSILMFSLDVQHAGATILSQPVLNVVDTNPAANVFQADLSADEQDVDIDGTIMHALIYKDDNNPGAYPAVAPNSIPVPQIVVNVGDEVIVKLTNRISAGCAAIACESSIHWHGLELDNDSDGTGVTQNHLLENETYTYRFRAPRPGVFWFHTHMLPGPQTFAVVIVPTGNQDDIITVTGLAYNRGGPSNNNPAGDLLYIKIDNTLVDTPFSIAAGNDVLGAGGVEDLKSVVITDFLIDPVSFIPGGVDSPIGSTNETIVLSAVGSGALAIDGVVGEFEDSGPDYTMVPYQATSRYALTGDTLELTISNTTRLHHPFHHHGFSFQPIRIVDNGADPNDTSDDSTLYTFDYDEFIDTIDVFDGQSVIRRWCCERISFRSSDRDLDPTPLPLFPRYVSDHKSLTLPNQIITCHFQVTDLNFVTCTLQVTLTNTACGAHTDRHEKSRSCFSLH
ncbi:MAG: multicopper oxidase domain-containing protein [Gammaproteobacteria bacterium]|nr:multicopper oxidase domain-containing protein [Gammaproteobacteria bacterium]